MKEKFLNSSISLITKNRKCSKEDIEIIAYGLESIYLLITKMIVIFFIAFILDVFKEMIILLIFYNIIRSQAFGIHASKSSYCLISSIILFIGGAFFCKYIFVPYKILGILALICNIFILMYAPADTYKRPLVNKKKRIGFKYKSLILSILYTIIILLVHDTVITKFMMLGMLEATILILPVTYKIFNLPYNNYKTYNYGV